MSLPEYSLKNKKVVWFFLFVLLAGGALGFVTLGKKEDSTFVIKSASLVCPYPGATPLSTTTRSRPYSSPSVTSRRTTWPSPVTIQT